MSRLIDADELIKRICGKKCGCYRNECGNDTTCDIVRLIEEHPTVITSEQLDKKRVLMEVI